MSVSMIADIVTILAFVSGVGLATKASVSRRSEEWIRSLHYQLSRRLFW